MNGGIESMRDKAGQARKEGQPTELFKGYIGDELTQEDVDICFSTLDIQSQTWCG